MLQRSYTEATQRLYTGYRSYRDYTSFTHLLHMYTAVTQATHATQVIHMLMGVHSLSFFPGSSGLWSLKREQTRERDDFSITVLELLHISSIGNKLRFSIRSTQQSWCCIYSLHFIMSQNSLMSQDYLVRHLAVVCTYQVSRLPN